MTLAIGIVTTVFTAFTFTRWLIAGTGCAAAKPKELPLGARAPLVPPDTKIPSWASGATRFALSGALSILSVVLFVTVGMNYGIDFKGGSLIEVQAKTATADLGDIRDEALGPQHRRRAGPAVRRAQRRADPRRQRRMAATMPSRPSSTKVRGELENDYEFRRVETVGPTVSSELARQGTIGVIVVARRSC